VKRFFGFQHLRVRPQPRAMDYGGVPFLPALPEPDQQIFAFTADPRTGKPRATAFSDDEDGHRALAKHCRIHTVLRVVRGVEVDIDHLDVVHVHVGRGKPVSDFQRL
jgi:hypothetical protein